MVDFIKTSRWRNLKNKIKRGQRKKTDPEQVEIDLSLMAAIENVHDALEMNTRVLQKINDDLYSSMMPVLMAAIIDPNFIQDPERKEYLKKNLPKDIFERCYGKEESDVKLHS